MFYEKDHHVYPVTRFIDIADSVKKIEPETENQKATYSAMLDSMKSANENRRARLEVNNYKITTIEWFCLIISSMISIKFSFFFHMNNRFMHALMMGMISLMVSLNLYYAKRTVHQRYEYTNRNTKIRQGYYRLIQYKIINF